MTDESELTRRVVNERVRAVNLIIETLASVAGLNAESEDALRVSVLSQLKAAASAPHVTPLFGELPHAGDGWFGSWPEKVVATVEANDFERQALWTAWAMESQHSYYRDKLLWRVRNPGTSSLIHGELFDTNISLNVAEIDGHFVLFWWPCSQRCDHELAEDWVARSFSKAVERTNANNFHNVVHAFRRLK